MDFVLEIGDVIYKSFNIDGYVAMEELPKAFLFINSTHFTAVFQNYNVHPVYITHK